jgi:hypothetical protein
VYYLILILKIMTQLVLWQGLGDLSHKFAVGTRVQAVWSEDGEWLVCLLPITCCMNIVLSLMFCISFNFNMLVN